MSANGFVEDREGYIIVGETITLALTWLEATSVSSPSVNVYFKGTDVTSTVMSSGSHSVSGTTQITKPMAASATHAGGKYVVEFSATVDGNTEIRKYQLACIGRGQEL